MQVPVSIAMHSGFGLSSVAEIRERRSRSLTAENPRGEKGSGGTAASELGPGRKGSAWISIDPGETVTLADVSGPGVLEHIWMTVASATDAGAHVLRDLILRAYWDDESEPSVEVPLGDFFANGHAMRCQINSHPIVVAPEGGMNSYWPMPFRESATVTLESQHPGEIEYFFYQIDYSENVDIGEDTGYFHAQWRRENPTVRGEDYTIVDGVRGSGRYVGTYLAWTGLMADWWGEGEVKVYVDGDEEYPTICGTGTEDYVGGAWRFGGGKPDGPFTYSTPYMGYPLYESDAVEYHGMYRWHVPDSIWFSDDLRVTVQAIGNAKRGFFEREDDIASVAYWYQHEPHATFPSLPGQADRIPR